MADKRPSRHPKDFNEVAFSVVQIATGQAPKPEPPKPKNPHAVTLGRMGGMKGGGKKRMAAMTRITECGKVCS